MRKTSAILASLSLAALALTGCASAPTFAGVSCDRASADSSIQDSVTVDGELGSVPDATVYTPVLAKETEFSDVVVGDGAAITTAFQPMVLDIAFFAGESGKEIFKSEFNGDLSRVHNISYWVQRSPGLNKVLECATAGTRIVAVLTPEDFGEVNVQGFGMASDENVVAVIDILDVHLAKAEGSSVFNDARGLPTVVRAPDGTPGVIIPDSTPPEDVVQQTLIKGDGAVVEETSTVITNIMAVGWDDKAVKSNTWGGDPQIGPAAQEFVGATVGSQLLVVVPGAEGVAPTAIVVDILGVVPAPEQ